MVLDKPKGGMMGNQHTGALDYVEVDLQPDEKLLILKLASFCVSDEVTLADLKNIRKKWIRFRRHAIADIAGELAHHCNHSKNLRQALPLDELIGHLENYLR